MSGQRQSSYPDFDENTWQVPVDRLRQGPIVHNYRQGPDRVETPRQAPVVVKSYWQGPDVQNPWQVPYVENTWQVPVLENSWQIPDVQNSWPRTAVQNSWQRPIVVDNSLQGPAVHVAEANNFPGNMPAQPGDKYDPQEQR